MGISFSCKIQMLMFIKIINIDQSVIRVFQLLKLNCTTNQLKAWLPKTESIFSRLSPHVCLKFGRFRRFDFCVVLVAPNLIEAKAKIKHFNNQRRALDVALMQQL